MLKNIWQPEITKPNDELMIWPLPQTDVSVWSSKGSSAQHLRWKCCISLGMKPFCRLTLQIISRSSQHERFCWPQAISKQTCRNLHVGKLNGQAGKNKKVCCAMLCPHLAQGERAAGHCMLELIVQLIVHQTLLFSKHNTSFLTTCSLLFWALGTQRLGK